MFGGSAGRSAWLAGILSLGCMTSGLDSLSSGEGKPHSHPHPRDAGVDSSISTGGTGAGGGTAAGGAAANGGNDGTGAMTSTGGSPADGGPPGGGDPCTEEGAHKCAGTAQKERLQCKDGVWEPAPACDADENCDTTPGGFEGLCQPIVPECDGKTGGTIVCSGNDRLECGKDLVSTTPVETCPFLCGAGECQGSCAVGTRM